MCIAAGASIDLKLAYDAIKVSIMKKFLLRNEVLMTVITIIYIDGYFIL